MTPDAPSISDSSVKWTQLILVTTPLVRTVACALPRTGAWIALVPPAFPEIAVSKTTGLAPKTLARTAASAGTSSVGNRTLSLNAFVLKSMKETFARRRSILALKSVVIMEESASQMDSSGAATVRGDSQDPFVKPH